MVKIGLTRGLACLPGCSGAINQFLSPTEYDGILCSIRAVKTAARDQKGPNITDARKPR
jgi:hypothetical protein